MVDYGRLVLHEKETTLLDLESILNDLVEEISDIQKSNFGNPRFNQFPALQRTDGLPALCSLKKERLDIRGFDVAIALLKKSISSIGIRFY